MFLIFLFDFLFLFDFFFEFSFLTSFAHHVVIHEESVDSLTKIVSDYAEIKMKGDTTTMRVLLVVDSSTGYLGATDVDQEGGSSGFAAK